MTAQARRRSYHQHATRGRVAGQEITCGCTQQGTTGCGHSTGDIVVVTGTNDKRPDGTECATACSTAQRPRACCSTSTRARKAHVRMGTNWTMSREAARPRYDRRTSSPSRTFIWLKSADPTPTVPRDGGGGGAAGCRGTRHRAQDTRTAGSPQAATSLLQHSLSSTGWPSNGRVTQIAPGGGLPTTRVWGCGILRQHVHMAVPHAIPQTLCALCGHGSHAAWYLSTPSQRQTMGEQECPQRPPTNENAER
jgi:hypothetical protein